MATNCSFSTVGEFLVQASLYFAAISIATLTDSSILGLITYNE